jgi:N-acetylglucosamine-6-phosphate deacetylase
MKTRMPIPGFVDLQVNGFEGIDFSRPDLTEADFAKACRSLLRKGTVAFLPTLTTSSPSVYEHHLPLMAQVMGRTEFRGRLLGLHLEGPFISAEPGAVGAHDPRRVRPPDLSLFARLCEWADGTVKLLTVAPEVAGMDELIRAAVARGVTVSLGHSLAEEAGLDAATAAGAVALTHLGNGLPNQLNRHHNPIWAGLADDRLTAMLITDGHHLPPPVIKAMIRIKGAGRIVIVSDASSPAGCPPGRYKLFGGDALLDPSGRLYNPRKQCLAGSSATLLQCMNHLASLVLLSLDELLKVGFFNPLRLIGVPVKSVRTRGALVYDDATREFTATTRS